ncbi:MAG: S8/S53 family peptidase [Chloroflexi bacterium]|nr:S8/S53 family peptidase [Chloroflexota bacterium]
MRKTEKLHPKNVTLIHAPSILVISGKPTELDEFDQKVQAGEFKEVLGSSQPQAADLGSLPPIYAYQKEQGKWHTTNLTLNGQVPLDPHASFQQAHHQRPVQVRRYLLDPSHDEPTLELGLRRLLRTRPEHFSSLEVHLEHIFQARGGNNWGAGGPTLREAPLKATGGKVEFAEQECFTRLGITQDDSRPTGKGVTVVVVDNSPEVAEVCHKTIDFWLDVSQLNDNAAAASIPPPSEEAKKSIFEIPPLSNVPEFTVGDRNRQHKENQLEIKELQPFHGLMIATLIRQIAPDATIVLVRVLDKEGEAAGTTIAHALEIIQYLKEAKIEANGRRVVEDKVVVNLSFGLFRSQVEGVDATYMLAACDHFCANPEKSQTGSLENLIVACSGNDSFELHPQNPEEPAAYGYFADTHATNTNLIAVAATSEKPGEYAWFSNQSNLGAPGFDLVLDLGKFSTFAPHLSRYVTWSGTSFATPLVAGSAAVLLSATKAPPANQIKGLLWRNATPPKDWNGLPEVNLKKTLAAL